MKFKLRLTCVALLAMATAPAWALQLGQIQVKSTLNQPLVAAIPLHPKNLTELDGLSVGLASADDFARAGLQLTPTDQSLRFHVVTDNNGQKLILITSSQPVTDPYLDFLVQVNTRQGRQVREFVVLLNPVIAAPAPTVQTAPVASALAASPPPSQPAELPAPPPPQPQPPKPAVQPQMQAQVAPKPRAASAPALPPPPPPPAAAVRTGQVPVHYGDTLYGIARDASPATGASINQMMLALKAANPEAFFKNNVNDLKAGAILRIPTRDEIDKTSIAEANAEIHRQYEAWRASKPHPATVVEGTAAQAAARTAPQPGPVTPASDHLALVPPAGEASGTRNRPGVAGGTGSETVTGLQQKLQTGRGTLISLNQSNADLESRVRSLKDIAGKSDKLLSLKDATVAELQRKLAAVQSGKPVTPAASIAATAPAVAKHAAGRVSRAPAGAEPARKPVAGKSHELTTPWFDRPLTWIVAALIVLALILIGLLSHRRRGGEVPVAGRGPLADPEDVRHAGTSAYAASLHAQLAEDPDNLDTHLALCRLYHAQGDTEQFVKAAEAMHTHVHDSGGMEWHEVAVIGAELAPGDPLFAMPAESQPTEPHADPYGLSALQQRADGGATDIHTREAADTENVPDAGHGHPPAHESAATPASVPEAHAEPASVGNAEPYFSDDPVDTKLDLARAYLDMGDPAGARAMLEEVIEEGSQTQKDQAKRLLAETSA